MQLRLTYDDYLVTLLTELAAAQERLAGIDEAVRDSLRREAVAAAARASAQLDGSPLDTATADAVDAGTWEPADVGAVGSSVGGWAAALRLEGMATQDVAAVEYANLLAVHEAEAELAAELFENPVATLARVHGLVCQGLVDPLVIGRPRLTEQAVHDGAQGMVIYNPAEPEAIPQLLERFDTWLRGDTGSVGLPAAVLAAVVHERLLQWQPYEAGNGRVARAAARLVLRARGLNGFELVAAERLWAAAPGPYYHEIAATLRRRDDLTLWVQRHTEALLEAAQDVVNRAAPENRPQLSARARDAAAQLPQGQTITVAEYAQQWSVSPATAAQDLRDLTVCGLVVREPRALGRRFRRR